MALFPWYFSEDARIVLPGPGDLWGLQIVLQKFSFFLKDFEV